ncbi:hypothetical protein GUITHDRAFT_121442 [Guillardia theta CCMP2712]|uniref:Uncharacterized protein n=1 Tax=Guillardia theta (strain CCMP2712) TaxID=905079 RepID=L1I8J1_GUITC|nr:hypothetical protein GUITHDRAFT_121442 [Guillardia theta CCMP2712]EKX32392.1 hypothetical protein GUITHDRAFT_121442 [Guillardia theta CCMP2712]|eukprot:XP_005819372.1 hypothetical protein GUITHDRAFT_121442 [Guillardia theta CCMP2712]
MIAPSAMRRSRHVYGRRARFVVAGSSFNREGVVKMLDGFVEMAIVSTLRKARVKTESTSVRRAAAAKELDDQAFLLEAQEEVQWHIELNDTWFCQETLFDLMENPHRFGWEQDVCNLSDRS